MALSEEDIKFWNTYKITDKRFIKQLRNYFVGAVLYECQRMFSSDLDEGYTTVNNRLEMSSQRNYINSVTYSDIKCFFNQKNCIPAHVSYWLEYVYHNVLGCVANYNIQHVKETDILQRRYIKYYREIKAEDKQNIKESKHRRRKLCKMYRDGLHSELFRHCGKPFEDFITAEEKEIADMILWELYHNQFNMLGDAGEERSISYILGRMQGRAEAERERNINNEQNT